MIQSVIAMARCSPTEFSEHFAEPGELWQALADALNYELIDAIEDAAGEFVDVAKRIDCGVRLYLRESRENPIFARVVAHRGGAVEGMVSLVHHYLPPHFTLGNNTARFSDVSLESAIDVIAGSLLAALQRITAGNAPADHAENVALAILRSLGVPGLQARRLISVELPRLQAPGESLLKRARLMHV